MRDFLVLMRWDNPMAAWWFVVPGLVLVLFFLYLRFRRRIRASIPGKRLFQRMAPGVSEARLWVMWLGMVLVAALVVVAIMRPRYGLKDVAVPGAGVDVAVVVDVSRSMLAKDVVPNRLKGAIVQIDRLLDKMRGDRVTLVPFAGLAYVQTPLTVDYEVIKEYLSALRVTDMPVQGTAIGRALKTAQRALGLGRKHRAGKYKGSLYKAIILFTDGENLEGDPLKVAQELKKQHVKVFTVGVGTPAGKPVPLLDKDGKVIGVQRAKDGKTPIISKLNEKLLKGIANQTGGEFFSYSGADVSGRIYKRLQEMEKIEYVHRVRSLLEDRFQYPLGLAVALLFLLLLYPLRRKAAVLVMLVAVLAAGRANAQGFLEKQHPIVAKAARLYAQGKYGEALKAMQQAEKQLPRTSTLAYDKALAEAGTKAFDASIKDLDFAISHLDQATPKALARLYYAKGTVLLQAAQAMQDKKKDRDQVIAKYRDAVKALTMALKYDPSNENARHNLELAVMGGYPPCSSMEDPFEDNDTKAQAKFVKLDPKKGMATMKLYICPNDPDYFKLPLNAGETMGINVKSAKKDGFVPVFTVEGPQKRSETHDALITTKNDGLYYIHVLPKGVGPDGAAYVMTVKVVPPCPQGDDSFEDNDSLDQAKPLKQGTNAARACPNDPDYFTVQVPKGKPQTVQVLIPKGQGPLSVTLYDDQANAQQGSHKQTPKGEVYAFHIKKSGDKARRFLLDVHGQGDGQGFYEVKIGQGKGGKSGKNKRKNKKNKKNRKNKDKQRKNQQKKQQQKQKKQKSQDKQAVEQLMKQLDKNPENIQAKDALKRFRIPNYRPQKDW